MKTGPIQLLIQQLPGAVFPDVVQLGHVADHITTYTAEVKDEWICVSTPHMPSCPTHGQL
jgi:hypothetical protein